MQRFTNFLYVLPVAMTQSFSSSVVIRYVLPVLWMSCFHIIGLMARYVYVYNSTMVPPTPKVSIEH